VSPCPFSKRIVACVALLGSALPASACGDNQTHPDPAAYDAGTPDKLACVPNLDGKIDRAELGAAIGVPDRYLVSPKGATRQVDVVGTVDADGHRAWDWSADYAEDQAATLTASAIDAKWYKDSFPGAGFVAPFDAGDTVEAIYKEDDAAISLLGLASTQRDPPEGRTLLVYAAPVPLYEFPLQAGRSWTSVGTAANATLRGLPYAGKDTYEVSVDASGQIALPDITFSQAIRVRTNVKLEPTVGAATSQRQVSFFFECFGEVARATSQNDEQNPDFTTAVEVRRLGFPKK
jgi:hypothetical protein